MAEALYVVEGDFTNEGKQYQAGTSLHFKAGNAHGPHATKNGCRLLVLWTERTSHESADLSDFTLASKAVG
jgi:quercetin dioxygenase-like cupin family protein